MNHVNRMHVNYWFTTPGGPRGVLTSSMASARLGEELVEAGFVNLREGGDAKRRELQAAAASAATQRRHGGEVALQPARARGV